MLEVREKRPSRVSGWASSGRIVARDLPAVSAIPPYLVP